MMASDSLRSIFAEIPQLADLPFEAWRTTPLGGLTNRSLRVSAGQLDYVLRLPGPAADKYLSRSSELHNARLAAELGLSPPVLFADATRGIMLLAFLPGSRHLTAEDLCDAGCVAGVAAVLARLHGSGLRFESTMAAFPIIDRYLAIGADERLHRLRMAAEPLRTALERDPMPAVPSHIDPNPANFLRGADGRLLLVDWEFSAMCEPVWDLAGIAIEGRLDPATEDLLLIAYQRGGIEVPRLRYRQQKAALHLVAASWAKAELAADPHRPEIAAILQRQCAAFEAVLESGI